MTIGIRVAAAPISWGVGAVAPNNPAPEAILAAIAGAGYAGCELGPPDYFGSTADEVLARFRAHNLALVATWHAVDLARPLSEAAAGELRHLAAILEAGGAGVLLVSDLITPERLAVVARVEEHPETWWSDAEWRQARQTLRDIAALAAEYGLTVAIHPHVGGHVESAREVRRLLDETAGDPVRFCLDTGHVQLGGDDPVALLAREAGRLVHVHLKDIDGALRDELRAGRIDYETAVGRGLYPDLAAGIVDWPGVARGLSGYAGWAVVEQDRLPSADDPRPFAANEHNRAFVRRLLGA